MLKDLLGTWVLMDLFIWFIFKYFVYAISTGLYFRDLCNQFQQTKRISLIHGNGLPLLSEKSNRGLPRKKIVNLTSKRLYYMKIPNFPQSLPKDRFDMCITTFCILIKILNENKAIWFSCCIYHIIVLIVLFM